MGARAMGIARSLVVAAESKRVAARAAYYAARHRDVAIREALQTFTGGISAAAAAAALQAEQALQARRDDGMPIADDQLSAASHWATLASNGRRQANRAAAPVGSEQAPDGTHLDVASDDEADGADSTYYHAMPGTIVVTDDDGNAERTTLHVIGGARIVEYRDGFRTKVFVTLKRETERDGIPTLVHVDPSCVSHATLLAVCERISRMAWKADRIESIPEQMSIWCSVGRYAGASDSPGWAYTGWAWLGYDRAAERAKQAKLRGTKAEPRKRTDISRVKRATIVASQTSEETRRHETAEAWPIGHDIPGMSCRRLADIARRVRETERRRRDKSSSKVQDVTKSYC